MISEYVVVVSAVHAQALFKKKGKMNLYLSLCKHFTQVSAPVLIIHTSKSYRIKKIKNANQLSTSFVSMRGAHNTITNEPIKRSFYYVRIAPRILWKEPGSIKARPFDTYAEAMTLALREGGEVIQRTSSFARETR